MTSLAGHTFGEYRLETRIGAGTLGETYRAQHVRQATPWAVKVIYPKLVIDPNFPERFRTSIAAAAALHHPRIISIAQYGEQKGQYYVAMELTTGGSLRSLLQRRSEQLPLPRAVDLVRQAAEALSYVHSQGLLHRDVKPENLMLGAPAAGAPAGDALRLADVGFMRLAESAMTMGGNVTFGSPTYMSPEACKGVGLDARSEVYSLGVVLYEVTTGYPPFEIKTLGDAVNKHLHQAPPSPRSVASGTPEPLEAIILKCLAKDPAARYQSANEMAMALQQLLDMLRPVRPVAPPPGQGPRVVLSDDKPKVVLADQGPRVVMRDETSLAPGAPPSPSSPPLPPVERKRFVVQTPGDGPPATPRRTPPGGKPPAGSGPPPQVLVNQGKAQQRPSVLPPERESGGRPGARGESRRIRVVLEPTVLTLNPGVPSIVRATIANTGHIVDHFPIVVEGVPDGWVELPAHPPQLNPGERSTVILKVLVPRDCSNRAGDYEVTVRALSRDDPTESGTASARWTLMPFTGSAITFAPTRRRGWRRAKFTATLRNQGNAPARYMLSGADEEQVLRCRFTPPQLLLEPCDSAPVAVETTAPFRWIGAPQLRPFIVRADVTSAAVAGVMEPPQMAHAQFMHRALIPLWVPPLLIAAALALFFLLRGRHEMQLAIQPAAVQLSVGGSVPLVGAVTNRENEVIPNQPVVWSSKDSTVASVSDSGVVHARREGLTLITANSGKVSATAQVTVVAARVEALAMTPKNVALKVGGAAMLRAIAKDATGQQLPRDVSWQSSDPTVATVGGNGRVIAKAPGSATITAQVESKSATAEITVAALPVGETAGDAPDCVAYDPASLQIQNAKAAGFVVIGGGQNILTMDNESDARRAMALARGYKAHCFLGRGNARPNRSDFVIEYWTAPSGIPVAVEAEDCVRYDRANLKTQDNGPLGWLLTDGKLRLLLADNEKDAKKAWDIALTHSALCFIGRGNRRPNQRDYIVQYWK